MSCLGCHLEARKLLDDNFFGLGGQIASVVDCGGTLVLSWFRSRSYRFGILVGFRSASCQVVKVFAYKLGICLNLIFWYF